MAEDKQFDIAETFPEGLQFLTYEDIARILRVKRSTVRAWVYRGLIRTNVKMGKKCLVPISELRRFVAEKTVQREKKVFPLTPRPPIVVPPLLKTEEETKNPQEGS